jgi:hypothetical protein
MVAMVLPANINADQIATAKVTNTFSNASWKLGNKKGAASLMKQHLHPGHDPGK